MAGPSLATTVAGVHLETCIYNASGPRTGSAQALGKIAASQAGAVLTKSATLKAQTGNPLPRTWHDPSDRASLNSEGLPNSGIEYYLDEVTIMDSMGSAPGKPYIVSLSGLSLDDNLTMLRRIIDKNPPEIKAIELNLACPNVIGKPIIAYDFVQMDHVLRTVNSLFCNRKLPPLGVKLPPYFDGPHFREASRIIQRYPDLVQYVVSINTIGNAFAVDPIAEMPVISSKGGFAGLSGPAVKFTALANVKMMRELLPLSVDVVGVGGVSCGQDAFEMILCGASAVQVGTCHWKEGPQCFDRICDELREIMKKKGYRSVDEFKGQIKEWSKDGASKSREARRGAGGIASRTNDDVSSQSLGRDRTGMIMNAILLAIIAVLLADKFGLVSSS